MSDKTRFFNVAQGSLEECRYYLILTQDLGYASTADADALLEEVSKLLVAYARAIESNRRELPLNSATPELLPLLNSCYFEFLSSALSRCYFA